MNCRETKFWIFSCRPNASWPAEVVAHVQKCKECQSLQAKLKQIDQGIERIGKTPSTTDLKKRILTRVEKTPQTAAPRSSVPSPRWRWHRVAMYLSGSAALILFGWFLGRAGNDAPTSKIVEVVREKRVDVHHDKIVTVNSSPDRGLFVSLLNRCSRLIQVSQTKERLEAMLDMADDCRQHALKLIDHGPRDTLPLTVDLYDQLLREGVQVQVANSVGENRPSLQEAARMRLKKMTEIGSPPKGLPQVVEDQREIMKTATLKTIELLDRPEGLPVPVSKNQVLSDSTPPTAALVQYAISYNSDADPLAKAGSCADCVQHLAPYVMLYMTEESSQQRAEIGEQFGEMINHGVYASLELATAKDPAKQVQEKAVQIHEATSKAIAQMEGNLQNAPGSVKSGIEKALEASKRGWEKGKGKGKGPPWLRNPANPEQKFPPGKGKMAPPATKEAVESLWEQHLALPRLLAPVRKVTSRDLIPAILRAM